MASLLSAITVQIRNIYMLNTPDQRQYRVITPHCLTLLKQIVDRAYALADWSAGASIVIRTAMIAITINSSTNV